jgi:hypothetical protein
MLVAAKVWILTHRKPWDLSFPKPTGPWGSAPNSAQHGIAKQPSYFLFGFANTSTSVAVIS